MSALSRDLARFAEQNAQVLGISNDSIYCHLAWQENSIGWQEYPMLSDYWPHAGVAQQYGILRLGDTDLGVPMRNLTFPYILYGMIVSALSVATLSHLETPYRVNGKFWGGVNGIGR